MILLVLALTLAQAVQETGVMRGRVTDKETGRGLPHAVVRVGLQSGQASEITAVTDDDGAFRIAALAPGRYYGFAMASRHLTASLTTGPSTASELLVKKGETLDVAVVLARSYAMNVHLIDAFGDPLSDIGVIVWSADDRRLMVTPYGRRSDDQGRLRVPGLAAGKYVICAEPGDPANATTPARRERLFRTCYPSAADDARAEPVTVDHDDLEDLEIRVRRGRTVSISGMVLDA